MSSINIQQPSNVSTSVVRDSVIIPVGRVVGKEMFRQGGYQYDRVHDARTQHLTVKLRRSPHATSRKLTHQNVTAILSDNEITFDQ